MKKEEESASLPYFSNTSDVYLVLKHGEPKQLSIYSNHTREKDFDWDHRHPPVFSKGDLHVHTDMHNSGDARKATTDEIRYLKYILKEFNYDYSKIKFD